MTPFSYVTVDYDGMRNVGGMGCRYQRHAREGMEAIMYSGFGSWLAAGICGV